MECFNCAEHEYMNIELVTALLPPKVSPVSIGAFSGNITPHVQEREKKLEGNHIIKLTRELRSLVNSKILYNS